MPDRRGILVGLLIGIGVGLYLALWFRWPTFLSVGIGAFLALATLLIATAVGDDPAEADAAWRDAAPDLAPRRDPGTGADGE